MDETLRDWYARRLRPRLRRAVARGDVSPRQALALELALAELFASEDRLRRTRVRERPARWISPG